jgi:hypothetical protein
MLERSPNFYPENYTSLSQVPNIVITHVREELFTGSSSINCYRVIYFQNARCWITLNMSLEVPVSSTYWPLIRVSKRQHPRLTPGTTFRVPMSLLGKISNILSSLGTVKNHTSIQFRVPQSNKGAITMSGLGAPARYSTSKDSRSRREEAVSMIIYHMGCPRIDEKEVARLACIDLPDRYLTSYNGSQVEEVISPQRPPSQNFCYNIQLLHRLRHKIGFLRLTGVTTDTALRQVKSYLVKWPDTACQLLLHRASDRSMPQSWSLVEYWSRQLLQRVGAVHAEGNVVGTLRLIRPPILVDALNQLHLWRFDTRVTMSSTASPFYPPEFRHLMQNYNNASIQTEDPLVTPAYDVYQCGQLLWMLATGWASPAKNARILKEEFYQVPPSSEIGFWFGPDPLPRLPDSVPAWFQKVVDACCADASKRRSCDDLLALFPHHDNNARTVVPDVTPPKPQTAIALEALSVALVSGRSTRAATNAHSAMQGTSTYALHALRQGDTVQIQITC